MAGILQNPNWLLRGFILVSIGIHLVIVLHLTGIYQSRAVSYIELSMQQLASANTRVMPRPRLRQKPPKIVSARPLAVPPTPQIKFDPITPNHLDKTPVWIPLPSMPGKISKPGLYIPGMDPSDVPAGPVHEGIVFTTAKEYFDLLNLRIHSVKIYPESARARHIEGRVKVEFILNNDGSMTALKVVTPSRSPKLNQAAMEAVKKAVPFPRPPAHLFTPPITLQITILFELA